jgi:hypothetical protein
MVVTITFDSNTRDYKSALPTETVPAYSPKRLGPDGAVLRF